MAIRSRILSSGKPKKRLIHRIILLSLTILIIISIVIAFNLIPEYFKTKCPD